MATLLTEAERRYLAAVLDNPDLAVEQIQGRDFAHPGYAAVYQAVYDLDQDQPELAGDDLTRAAADRAGALGLDADRLEQLRADAPEPEHVEFYASMVLDGAFQRELGAYAQTALASGEDGDEHAQRVNTAIARHAEHYRQLFNTPWPEQAVAAEALETATRTGHEELLVASIMVYPEQVRDLVAIAPPESVEDFRCRVAYEAVASAAWDGDAISDLDLVWQVAKAQEMNAGLDGPPIAYTEPDAAFIARLARTDVTEHTGIDTAQRLLAADARATVGTDQHPTRQADPIISPASVFASPTQIDPHAPPTPQQQGPVPHQGPGEESR